MPDVIFHHPNLKKDLVVTTGANQIMWGYGLNTQAMPTYGGEVVQILSAYVDDLQIQGEIPTYHKMESIYQWFLEYMQTATQREKPGDPRFVETPVAMSYPERDWHLLIKPKGVPGFRYGTDVVAPAWQILAAVVERDPAMDALTLKEAIKRGFDFSQLHGGIGYDDENPFTDPAASGDKYDPKPFSGEITDFYTNLIPSYLQGDFDPLLQKGFLGSKPVFDSGNKDQQNQSGKANQKDTPTSSINAILGGG